MYVYWISERLGKLSRLIFFFFSSKRLIHDRYLESMHDWKTASRNTGRKSLARNDK